MKISLEKIVETIFLIFVFSFLLWIGLGNLWDHTITHPLPIGTLASDNFLHVHYTEYLLKTANMQHTSLASSSGFDDIIWHYAVILSPISAQFAKLTGLQSYDATILLVFFFSILGVLVMYFTIKTFNKTVAILSIPLTVFLFSNNFYFIFLWGQYQMIISTFFVIISLWCLTKLDIKRMYIVLGIALSASFHAHQSETIVLIIFIGLYTAIKLIATKKFTEIIELCKAAGVFFAITFYDIMIFLFSYNDAVIGKKLIDLANPATEYLKTVSLTSFGIVLIALLIGAIISFFYLNKKIDTVILYAFFMMLWGNMNILGGSVAVKTLPQRFVWPITLSILLGIFLYTLIKITKIKFNRIYAFAISVILIILATLLFYQNMGSGTLVNQYQWNAIKWIEANVPEKESVLFFYGDMYSQHGMLYNDLKTNYWIEESDYVEKLKHGILSRSYVTQILGEYMHDYPYWKGFLSFGKKVEQITIKENRSLCIYDYIVFDIESRTPIFAEYNKVIINQLLKYGYTKAYENPFTVILNNKNKTKNCIPEIINVVKKNED